MQDYIRAQDKRAAKKEKERARHQNVNLDDIDFIPAKEPPPDIFHDDSPKRVGVYIRVSTESENQVSSFVMQEKAYTDLVKSHPNWVLVDIYADADTPYGLNPKSP